MERKKLRASFASYKYDNDDVFYICDLTHLAEILLHWSDTPKTLCDVKAMELSLLASKYLELVAATEAKEEC